MTAVALSRKGYEEIADSFPKLLDALEEHAADRLAGVELGDIEWYHRLRNQLYHQESGLTVEREKVEVYASVAKVLFKNLFGQELQTPPSPDTDRVGRFLTAWVNIERDLQLPLYEQWLGSRRLRFPLQEAGPAPLNDAESVAELNQLRGIRNNVVHQGHIPSDTEMRSIEKWVRAIKAAVGRHDAG